MILGVDTMTGKQKCKYLKEIRKQIADINDIPFVVEECPHKGDCKGTCPKCEEELRYLEAELAKRKKKTIAIAAGGVAAAVLLAGGGNALKNAVDDMLDDIFHTGFIDPDYHISPQ